MNIFLFRDIGELFWRHRDTFKNMKNSMKTWRSYLVDFHYRY
jgi:hypothetical protein